MSLSTIGRNFQEKLPVIEKSLDLVKALQAKRDENGLVARYSLADAIYGKAEIDTSGGIVNLWLGANVMLEYTYEEAIELLSSKLTVARKEFQEVSGPVQGLLSKTYCFCCVRQPVSIYHSICANLDLVVLCHVLPF